MDFFDDKIAQRLGGINFYNTNKIYKFEKIKKAKKEAIKRNPHIALIDMGIGEPDLPADSNIIKMLCNEAEKKENKGYADNGILEFQEAAAKYLEKIYGLKNINPSENILHGIGSKSILSMIPLCFVNPGDIVLTTVPGYPVIGNYTEFLGGTVYNLPLYKENNFYPDLSKIPKDIIEKSKLLYINYPNNPTGQIPTKEFYEQVVHFAYKNNILVISDAAYGAIAFDGYKPLSFLSIDGGSEVGLEIHSLSKAFNMTGWRLAFMVGHSKLIKAYSIIKGHTDSGQFKGIQKAGVYALNHPEITDRNAKRYSKRFDLLIPALREVGFEINKPRGSFYCYVPIPKGTKSGILLENAEQVSLFILQNSLISTVPWDDAGSFLRFSVTFEADTPEEEIKLIKELKNRLLRLNFIF